MVNKFLVAIPLNVKKLNLGFSTYEKTKTIICEAATLLEIYNKFPQALIIKQLVEKK